MAKRPHLDEAVKRLHKIAREEDEDFLVRREALVVAAKLEPLVNEFESVMSCARMGRHARPEQREKQLESDLRCYERVEQLHKRMPLDEAFAQWGEHQEATVRKAYYRGKKLNQRKTKSRKRT
jgi:hypothetical protein